VGARVKRLDNKHAADLNGGMAGLLEINQRTAGLVAVAAVALAGCAGSGAPLGLQLPLSAAETPVTSAVAVTSPATPSAHAASLPVAESYSRLAGGLLKCWFGADGPLRASHIFHGELPAAPGAGSEIILHERDPTQPNPRGTKAMRIAIVRDGDDRSTITFEAPRLKPEIATAIVTDANAWLRANEVACSAGPFRPMPPPVVVAKKQKAPQRGPQRR
jgi:hypothetical protein